MTRKKIAGLLATMLGASAIVFVTTACWVFGNRPEVPQELLKR
ncbi:cyclic lactone autoinducer peptide [Cohnella endophytica]|uniref:Cyclic lactone autoinducer peptide n=1 Tax=Cohnella endophytica TaxID=2419778 RepID=A0A494XW29_9BACL|nr:cyclic lactone autoinducer peptide [Cohnella endophytica]RKP53176.1 cyclic lactone autoinducer peptide [Cohnella endophytica]